MDLEDLTRELETFIQRHSLSDESRDELLILLNRMRYRPPVMRAMDSATFELENDEHTQETLPGELGMTWRPISAEVPNPNLADRDAPQIPGNYQLIDFIGEGGMGQVWRVRDRDLGRTMALKVIRRSLAFNPDTVSRFIAEARLTSQLEHGGIVPVHGFSQLEDGRVCFTMKEVRGRTLLNLIQDVHLGENPGNWTLRRLVDRFLKICEAVAYAHSKGVAHRDIKSMNIMVGEFGEVRVLDWGLAKVLGTTERTTEHGASWPEHDPVATLSGRVMGTPMYMSPEQARGENHNVGPCSDVFSLGVVMYELLTGHCPFIGSDPQVVLAQSLKGPPEMRRGRFPIPNDLRAVCFRAMSPEMLDRYPDASGLVSALQSWFEGERQKDHARSVVTGAAAMIQEVEALREKATATRELARMMLAATGPASSEVISKGKERWEEARRLEREAESRERTYTQTLEGALEISPELPEALEKLADHYRRRHERWEQAGDAERANEAEARLRQYDRGRHTSYLRGDGAISLSTDPPAQVTLHAIVDEGGVPRLTAARALGETPLQDTALTMGSYLLTLSAPGRPVVRYPITLKRMQYLDNVPPGSHKTAIVSLPERLGDDECFIPAGWFQSGGDPEALNSLPASRVWLDSFVIQQHPVSHQQLLVFLNDLCRRGKLAEVRSCLSQRGPTLQRPLYALADNTVTLDDAHSPDDPASMSWRAAQAYARWYADHTGLPWRLPGELEWEKAMRGVDGRAFPWGSQPGEGWSPTDRGALWDQSPYGVRDCAGPVADWCAEVYTRGGPELREGRIAPQDQPDSSLAYRVFRGGTWFIADGFCRPASRDAAPVDDARVPLRARLVRSLA